MDLDIEDWHLRSVLQECVFRLSITLLVATFAKAQTAEARRQVAVLDEWETWSFETEESFSIVWKVVGPGFRPIGETEGSALLAGNLTPICPLE
jgi:hypothetical protein